MSRGVNKVFLVGNVGSDPEIRDGDDDTSALAKFSLATSEKFKSGEKTEWHRIVVWGALADVVDKYVRKGNKLCIVGRIRYGKYTDRDGVERYTVDINADELIMLGSPGGAGGREDEGGRGNVRRAGAEREREPAGDYDEPEEVEERNARRAPLTEDDVPPKDRPDGLNAATPRKAGTRPATSSQRASGSKTRGPVRKPRKAGR